MVTEDGAPSAGQVLLDIADGRATITLDYPKRRNALSRNVRRQLSEHLTTATADDHVRVIVLTHTGPVFCAGLDLSETSGGGQQGALDELAKIINQIWTTPKPVIARIGGRARAGGIGLIAACDIAIATDDADFAFTEVRIGVIPAVIAVPILRRANRRRAGELMLTGETLSAQTAVDIDLVSRCVPSSDLDEAVDQQVRSLLLGAPNALGLMKATLQQDISEELHVAVGVSARLFDSVDGQEGIAAFREKRPPRWQSVPPPPFRSPTGGSLSP